MDVEPFRNDKLKLIGFHEDYPQVYAVSNPASVGDNQYLSKDGYTGRFLIILEFRIFVLSDVEL